MDTELRVGTFHSSCRHFYSIAIFCTFPKDSRFLQKSSPINVSPFGLSCMATFTEITVDCVCIFSRRKFIDALVRCYAGVDIFFQFSLNPSEKDPRKPREPRDCITTLLRLYLAPLCSIPSIIGDNREIPRVPTQDRRLGRGNIGSRRWRHRPAL